ncbi:MAG TPA: branched chain amino acid aminotransferase, partial [Corynebacterium falsenii]|nr:branched chain amino acid aminotransferase [Corynebacterium falsenii]
GELSEVFACGTAAVVTPVGTVKSKEGEFSINEGKSGEITMKLREILTGIQRGVEEDKHGWLYTLVEAE